LVRLGIRHWLSWLRRGPGRSTRPGDETKGVVVAFGGGSGNIQDKLTPEPVMAAR
jgi:hypothetical protein